MTDFDPETDVGGPWHDELFALDHQRFLYVRAVHPDVARARGYATIVQRGELKRQGGLGPMVPIPGLLIPHYRIDGERAGVEFRPDQPRTGEDGRYRKYERPRAQRVVVDVPKLTASLVMDATHPLWITESAIKADALSSQGCAAVGVPGVWGWRDGDGPNVDWEAIPLKGREVLICFDSDAISNEQVSKAMARLGDFLTWRGAKVRYVYVPATPDGGKQGVDDYFAVGGSIAHLLSRATEGVVLPPSYEALAELAAEPDYADVDEEPLADVFDALEVHFRDHLHMANDHVFAALVLWAVNTWVVDQLDIASRLIVTSPMHESGKSRVLEVLEPVVCHYTAGGNISTAGLAYVIGATEGRITVAIDELDQLLGSSQELGSGLTGIINLGWRRGQPYTRANPETGKPTFMETFAPVALASIGLAPFRASTLSRSVVITMQRATAEQQHALRPWRMRDVAGVRHALGRRVGAAAIRHLREVGEDYVLENEPLDGISGRSADLWEPLIAIAGRAGPEWAERAREAAVWFRAERERVPDTDELTTLLTDLETVLTEAPAQVKVHETVHGPAVTPSDLVAALKGIPGGIWLDVGAGQDGLTRHSLGHRLGVFQLQAVQFRVGQGRRQRGYLLAELANALNAYRGLSLTVNERTRLYVGAAPPLKSRVPRDDNDE